MASKRKIREVVAALLAKARADKVNWRVNGVFDEGRMPMFGVVVTNGSMDVGLRRPKAGPEEYVFFLEEGDEEQEIRSSDPNSKDWCLLAALYGEAKRWVDSGADGSRVVRKSKRGVIGKEPEQDLPFWAASE
jgi:hypothetical protein